MLKGNLSNDVLPRVYVVFEGLLGTLPDTKTKGLETLARKRKKWDKAIEYYQLNVQTTRGMRDLYWRHRFRVDIITFIDPSCVSPIREKLDSRNILFGNVHYYTTDELLSDLTYDQGVLAVLDPEPSRQLLWGSKGRYCAPEQLNLLNIIV